MGRIERALKEFNLDSNFTENALQEAFKSKQNIIYTDFKNGTKDYKMEEQDRLNYQILVIYRYLRDMLKDIDLNKKGLFNISIKAKEFYEQEPNHSKVSQLFDFISMDVKNLEADIERVEKSEEIEKSYQTFLKTKQESYQMFINNMLYGRNNAEHHETLNNQLLEETVSMKEVILNVYSMVINRDYMLNDIRNRVNAEWGYGKKEPNKWANYYMNMKTAKSYEELKTIYELANKELLEKEDDKKAPSR